jgi:hypothetical protein
VKRVNETTLNSSERNEEPGRFDGARERLAGFAENPAVMLLGGMALGFLAGLLLPVSRYESERLRPLAEDVKGRVREAGGEVMRRGSEVLKETIDATRDAAVESLRQQTSEWQTQQTAPLSGGTGTGLQQANTNLGPGQ